MCIEHAILGPMRHLEAPTRSCPMFGTVKIGTEAGVRTVSADTVSLCARSVAVNMHKEKYLEPR